LGVDPDALVLRITKTRAPKIYAKGRAAIPRSTVSEIHLRHARYRWRVIGTAVGAAAGVAVGWIAALLICYEEHPGCTGPATAAFVGTMGGLATLGHLTGREADRRVTIIKIISQPCSGHPTERQTH